MICIFLAYKGLNLTSDIFSLTIFEDFTTTLASMCVSNGGIELALECNLPMLGIEPPTSTDIVQGLRFISLCSPNYHNQLYSCNVEYLMRMTKSKAEYMVYYFHTGKVAFITGLNPPNPQYDK